MNAIVLWDAGASASQSLALCPVNPFPPSQVNVAIALSSASALLSGFEGLQMCVKQLLDTAVSSGKTQSLDPQIYHALVLTTRFKRRHQQLGSVGALTPLQPLIDKCGIAHVPGLHASAKFFNERIGKIPSKFAMPETVVYPKLPKTLDPGTCYK